MFSTGQKSKMYLVSASIAVVVLTFYKVHETFYSPTNGSKTSSRRACVDMMSIGDVVHFVRVLSRPTSDTNDIAERIERVLARFPPDEHVMRRLSVFQQRLVGQGGEQEFCVVTVFMIANVCIEEGRCRPLPLRRTNSISVKKSDVPNKTNETRQHGTMECHGGRVPCRWPPRILDALGTHQGSQTSAPQREFHS